ncbi:type II secretion system protein N [Salinisphaera sp.]|uniref:type II secretion system protein N n=1 Tax=Salinisphaera sp. TaxID=1914330 RepID=UPI002D77A95B|nr:type II secretion system protein N [Salinisphaera sp.]HET7315510.1 type II secretion system protein N [Salinisphaera sp.]
MSWRIVRFVVVGLVAFVVGLITYLPASLVAGWVAGDTPVRLAGVSGTLLNGRAAYASLPHGALDNVRWHVHPAALLTGSVAADIRVDSDLGRVRAKVRRSLFGHNTLEDIHGEATIGWLAKLAGYTFVPVSGRIRLDLDRLAFDDDLHIDALSGTLQLTNSRWELFNPPLELGRFKAELSRGDTGVALRIVDSQGALALTGSVKLSDNQHYDLNVKLRARAGADARLEQILQHLGEPDSEGWYHVRERGSL